MGRHADEPSPARKARQTAKGKEAASGNGVDGVEGVGGTFLFAQTCASTVGLALALSSTAPLHSNVGILSCGTKLLSSKRFIMV